MIASFFLALREGLEAALIIGVLLGTLTKLGRKDYQNAVWMGTALALLTSLIVGIVLNILGAKFEGRAEEIFEGVTMILAAGILTWVIIWMQSQARVYNAKLEADIHLAVIKRSQPALFFLSYVAVIREGIELAFFLTAVALNTGQSQVLLGAGLGLAAVAVISYLLFKSLIRLNFSRFFQVTSIILVLFAAGLVGHGIHEFNEAGIVPTIIEHVWNLNYILDERSSLGELLKALFGYNGDPSLSEVIGYLFYYVVLGVLITTLSGKEVANNRSG